MGNKIVVPVITLDGPSGTGKGTLCYKIANHLGWHVLDSGCIYRVLSYAATKYAIEASNAPALVALAQQLDVRFQSDPHLKVVVYLENEEISTAIRSEECGQNASKIAAIPEVREALVARQRAFAKPPGLVTDGRDMGTIIFPDAVLKIFLSASPQIRAKRRYLQLKNQGIDVSLAQVVEELVQRDARDTTRLHAPLKAADDAVSIDTTGLTVNQVFTQVLDLLTRHPFFQ